MNEVIKEWIAKSEGDFQDLHFLTRAAVEFRYPGESADREEAEGAFATCVRLRKIFLPGFYSMETQ